MKKAKRMIALLLVIVSVMAMAALPVNAAYVNTGKSFSLREGGFLGIGATSYTYKIFKDNRSWYAMFHRLDVCPAIFHSKGKGPTSLTYMQSKTYTSQTADDFSVSVGGSVGISKLVGLTAEATGGQTKSYSYAVSASGSVGRTIPSTASTGYYKMTICYNFDKFRLDKYKSGSSSRTASYYPCLPKGNAYVSVLYGTSTSNSAYTKY